ncbi:MAG: ABC transporter substrate-binding protein [Desulfatitalea sp.]|nr:ABC transporter substrate-binding protein [Desulfatitalea sp.]
MNNNTWKTTCVFLLMPILSHVCFSDRSGAESKPETPPLKLKVGVYPTTYTRLIAVADAKGFFGACGLDVKIRKYPSGTSALEAVIRGEVEIATVVDFRFAWRMLAAPRIRAVASTGEVFESRIVARRDRGIRLPADLKGKRIGFVPNTISEYALHAFLLENGIDLREVHPMPVRLLEQSEAVVDGRVDAVSAFVTFAFNAVDGLGVNGVAWDSRFHTVYNALLVVKEGMVASPEAIPLFLKALLMAEAFSLAFPEEAKRIVMEDWEFSRTVIDQFWDKTRVTVSLNQSLVVSLNLYVKWLMQKNQIKGDPPDVLSFIDTNPLDRIDPLRVTIFR